ncbi:MAG: monofunctional biosynthetic peptidoglycan transglycosylase [Shimia sp.]
MARPTAPRGKTARRKTTAAKTARAPKIEAKTKAEAARRRPGPLRLLARGLAGLLLLVVGLVALGGALNPPTTPYIVSEARRLGEVRREWVSLSRISPDLARAVVAAEDANFCLHWGFDTAAIRAALEAGALRGGSTITQQVVKNVFLWHGRSWSRKAIEALLTPVVEATWSKRRILEVYLNVAEFDTGVFGAEAAALHHFGVDARNLTPAQAARLAAVLPDPKGRSAVAPSPAMRTRAAAIADGALTIRRDGRAACFEA